MSPRPVTGVPFAEGEDDVLILLATILIGMACHGNGARTPEKASQPVRDLLHDARGGELAVEILGDRDEDAHRGRRNLIVVLVHSPSRPRLAEFFEQGHEAGIGADRVEVRVGRDLLGTPPAVLLGEAQGVEGPVGVMAG